VYSAKSVAEVYPEAGRQRRRDDSRVIADIARLFDIDGGLFTGLLKRLRRERSGRRGPGPPIKLGF